MVRLQRTARDTATYTPATAQGRITKVRTYERPPSGAEVLLRTWDYSYDGNNNVATQSIKLDDGEIITITRTFDHYWLSSKKTVSSKRPGEVFQTDYAFHYDSTTDYPTNIKERKRRKADGSYLTTTYTYNTNGQLTETEYPDGHTIINVYTGDKRTKTYHKIAGAESPYLKQQFAYDNQDNLSQVTNARGHSTHFITDDLGRIVQVTNAKNEETHFRYDPAYLGGTVLREIERGKLGAAGGQVTRLSYTPQGWRNQVERQKDSGAWLTVQSATFNSNGRPLTSSAYRDTTPLTSNMTYDALGRMLTSSDPKQKLTQYKYDALGNRIVMIDARSRETAYTYDDMNRLIETRQDKNGLDATTVLDYDAAGNLLAVSDPENSVTTYTYDSLSRRTKVTQPLGAPHEVTTVYDDRDRVDYVVNARGHKIDYGYELWGGLKDVRYYATVTAPTPDRTVTYSYDHNGNIEDVTDDVIQPSPLYSFTYDELDRPNVTTAKYLPSNVTMASSYDRFGNRSGLVLNDGSAQTFGYTFNKLNQLNNVVFPGGQHPSVTYYEDLGTYKQVQFASGITTDFLYEDNGPIKQIKTVKSDTSLLEQLDYVYDDVLNVDTLTSFRDGGVHDYGYDSLDHLTDADHPGAQTDEAFEYDLVGNREQPGNSSLYDYNANHQIEASPGSFSYQFDDDGNLSTKLNGGTTETFTHNKDNRLTDYLDGGVAASYQYDPFGRRISKTVGGVITYFLWDGSGLQGEYSAAGVRTKRYHYLPGDLAARQMEDQGSVYDVHLDHLQTAKVLTDSNEVIVWSQVQGAFGEMVVLPTSTVTFNVRFPGQYFDGESGLHYNYFRDYDPSLGRYVQGDPIGLDGGVNTYGYAGGNPVRYMDRYGLESQSPEDRIFPTLCLTPAMDCMDLALEAYGKCRGAYLYSVSICEVIKTDAFGTCEANRSFFAPCPPPNPPGCG